MIIVLYLSAKTFNCIVMKRIVALLFCLPFAFAQAQSAWPSESWNTATPLTSVMNAGGLLELSGLHWNPETNRLYAVHGDGRLRVLQLNTVTNTFSQIGNKTITGGPEGITQADLAENEFYTIDENNYEIRKYTHTANFSSVTEAKHWNLLQSPSPMTDTGNAGPEGIVFIPDANLSAIGFRSPLDSEPYTSVKGAGGLFFVAHQNGGYVWIFDINPNTNNDFAYVGKIKTKRSESCDLSFDRSTGLLYILHNVGANYLEVSDLAIVTDNTQPEPHLHTVNEYFIANPADGNTNIEGFAIMPKCDATATGSAFLCRDVESNDATAIQQDAIRWFNPYTADGTCIPLTTKLFTSNADISVYPNPASGQIFFSGILKDFDLRLSDALGKTILRKRQNRDAPLDVSTLQKGFYFIEVISDGRSSKMTWIKQ